MWKNCMCWCLSIIELKNARWNIEIHNRLLVLIFKAAADGGDDDNNVIQRSFHYFGFF